MNGKTHTAVGIATGLALVSVLPTVTGANYTDLTFSLGASVIGALFPDLDLNQSKGNQVLNKVLACGIPAMLLYYCFARRGFNGILNSSIEEIIAIIVFLGIGVWCRTRPHREASHSLLMCSVTTLAVYTFTGGYLFVYYAAGFLSHLAIDLLNTKGESLLWPSPGKYCFSLCKAGGVGDKAIGYAAGVLSVLLLLGGATAWF